MVYKDLVKCAYEDIIDNFEKEAANRLFRDGLDGAKKAIQGRIDNLKKPAAELNYKAVTSTAPPWRKHFDAQKSKYLSGNPAADNAYHNRGYNINHSSLSDRLGQGRGTQYAENVFKRGTEGFKKNPLDSSSITDMQWAGRDIKNNYNSLIHDLSNHKRSLTDIKRDAWKKLERKKDLENRLSAPVLKNGRMEPQFSPEAVAAKMQEPRAKEIINRGARPGSFKTSGFGL